MKSLALSAERNSRAASPPRRKASPMRWPETRSCVLIISDDESDYED